METKHTPGPWKVATTGRIVEIVSEFGEIAMVHGGGSPDDETMPNARLIASAPALLEALKTALMWVGRAPTKSYMEVYEADRAQILAAIAQAEGE